MVWKYGLQKTGIRYQNRQPPLWMKINLKNGLCWCGKSFKWPRRKYCSDEHADLWFFSIRAYWNSFRTQVIQRDNFTCTKCGFHKFKDYSVFDVDHILAITNGGMCYDLQNVRTLCKKCHRIKTSDDIREMTRNKKGLETIINFI